MFSSTLPPDPILFQVNTITVHWYGLLLAMGVFFGYLIVLRLAKAYRYSINDTITLFFWTVVGGFLGARLYHVLNEPAYYAAHPLDILQLWNGGLAIHGALFGGAIVIWFFARRKKQSFWWLADLLAPSLVIGQAIGRWGNYFNQELFGKPTNLPWAISIDLVNVPAAYAGATFFHPTFLYESLWNLIIFIILILLHRLRIFSERTQIFSGVIFIVYLILYSGGRIVTELLRIDRTPVVFGVRLPIVVSGLLIILGIVAIVYLVRRWRRDISSGKA